MILSYILGHIIVCKDAHDFFKLGNWVSFEYNGNMIKKRKACVGNVMPTRHDKIK